MPVILLCLAVALNGQDKGGPKIPIGRQLAEINKSFTYRGKTIHPRAVKDLVSWVADPLPGPIAIDVEGTFDTNRYFGDYETRADGFVFVDLTQKYVKETGWFSYKHLGRLQNGYHVIRTFDNAGGTGVFQSLLLVEALVDFEYEGNGARRQALVLRRRGEFGIGDRYDGTIQIDPKRNRITVGPDKQNIDKPYVIRIP